MDIIWWLFLFVVVSWIGTFVALPSAGWRSEGSFPAFLVTQRCAVWYKIPLVSTHESQDRVKAQLKNQPNFDGLARSIDSFDSSPKFRWRHKNLPNGSLWLKNWKREFSLPVWSFLRKLPSSRQEEERFYFFCHFPKDCMHAKERIL